MELIAFDTFSWFATVIRRVAEILTVEALSHWSGVFAKFVDLKYFAYIGACRESNWMFGNECVSGFICFG
jgi:hypothetical protein